MYSGKKAQHDFPKMRGGGIKGRLELFQKFIRFGEGRLPLVSFVLGWLKSIFISERIRWNKWRKNAITLEHKLFSPTHLT